MSHDTDDSVGPFLAKHPCLTALYVDESNSDGWQVLSGFESD